MDAVAHLSAEHVIDEAVLSDAAEASERGGRDDGAEVMSVSGDLGLGPGYPRLDALFQFVRRSRHKLKPSVAWAEAILVEA